MIRIISNALLISLLTNEAQGFLPSSKSSRKSNLNMWTVDSIGPTLASLSVIAGITAFHEAGHFIAAKSQGMTIQSFNIGFGPKLVSFNDSSNTEFSFR